MNVKDAKPDFIIHHVSKRPWPAWPKEGQRDEWIIAYERRGEWEPKTVRLIDLLTELDR